jgi:late competence protein required for DNA uptake (superfamily II DNA/RNA helicase)
MEYTKDSVIRRYNTIINDIFKQEYKNTDNNYKMAYIAELYCCIILMNKYNKIFVNWKDVPIDFKIKNELSEQDTGIDFTDLDKYYGQCKLRSKYLSWRDACTFLAHLGGTNIKGILSYNDDITLHKQILMKSHIIHETFNKDEMINYFRKISSMDEYNYYIEDKNKITFEDLRDYQIECINLLKNNENNKQNIIIKLPTGSGKTVIMTYSINKHLKYLILVPYVVLLDQTKDKVIEIHPKLKNKIQTFGDGNSTKYNPNKSIVICVYNSVNKILDYIKDFNKIYIDEAHHIIDSDMNNNCEDDNFNYIDTIYNFKNYNNCVYFSATINQKPEYLYYTKNVRWMIENNYLCDYIIKFPIFSDTNDKSIVRYLVDNQYYHFIIYCSDRENGIKINNYLNELLPNSSEYIDCYTKKSKRKEYIEKYKKGELKFLVNIRVLTEGFDAPITNGVCLLHVPQSERIIIQICGRALRKYTYKNIATIMIPIAYEEEAMKVGKTVNIICDNDYKYKELFRTKKYSGYIELENVRWDREDKYNSNPDSNPEEKDNTIYDCLYELTFDSLGNGLNNNGEWNYKLERVKKYINTNDKRPATNSKNPDEKKLGQWISNQLKNYQKNINIMSNIEIRTLWEDFVNDNKYNIYFLSNETTWINTLDKIKKYINTNNKRPAESSKNPDEKKLGLWISHQLNNYQKNINIMSNIEIRTLWEEFVNDDKYNIYFLSNETTWINTLERVKKYINTNNKRPAKNSKNPDEKKLGQWISNQLKNYQKNIKIMSNIEIRTLWEDFVNNNKYKKYFKNFIIKNNM